MKLITRLLTELLVDDSYERIIGILSIALVTIICLLILSLFKAHKLKARIKEFENKE